MPAHYSVIQYVPDPVRDERVNIGVVGFHDGDVRTQFLMNWHRVRVLWGKDAVDLKRIEAIFRDIDESRLTKMMETYQNSIQFTPPSASIRSIEETMAEAARRFLVDPAITTQRVRLHADVLASAKQTLIGAVSRKLSAHIAKNMVRPRMEVPGRFGVNRHFDLGVRNGSPIHAIQALSFAGSKTPERRVEATAFLVEEVISRLPVTVVVAAPGGTSVIYDNARKTLKELKAEVVTEDEFPAIATRIANELAAHAA